MYQNLFEKLRKQSKKLYFQNRVQNDSFPKSLIIANEEITDKKSMAEKFNSFFVNTRTNLAAKVPHGTINFKSYLPNIFTIFREDCLTE